MINTQLSTFPLLIIVNVILLKSTPIYEQDEIMLIHSQELINDIVIKSIYFLKIFLHSESKMHI